MKLLYLSGVIKERIMVGMILLAGAFFIDGECKGAGADLCTSQILLTHIINFHIATDL